MTIADDDTVTWAQREEALKRVANERQAVLEAPAKERLRQRRADVQERGVERPTSVVVMAPEDPAANNEAFAAEIAETADIVRILLAEGKRVEVIAAGVRERPDVPPTMRHNRNHSQFVLKDPNVAVRALQEALVHKGLSGLSVSTLADFGTAHDQVYGYQDVADVVRDYFDENPDIDSVEVVGPSNYEVMVRLCFENSGLPIYFDAPVDLALQVDDATGTPRYLPAHGVAYRGIPSALGMEPEPDDDWKFLAHNQHYSEGLRFLEERVGGGADVTVLAIRSRHPLINGKPGPQFAANIRKTAQLARRLQDEGREFIVATFGEPHMPLDNQKHLIPGVSDPTSLGLAGARSVREEFARDGIDLRDDQVVVLDHGVTDGEEETDFARNLVFDNARVGLWVMIGAPSQSLRTDLRKAGRDAQGVLGQAVLSRVAISRLDPLLAGHSATWEAIAGRGQEWNAPFDPTVDALRRERTSGRVLEGGIYADEVVGGFGAASRSRASGGIAPDAELSTDPPAFQLLPPPRHASKYDLTADLAIGL